jgi:hypothetical protein
VCLGFLGSYVGAIYLETKGRPNFIIKELIGFEDDQPVPMAQRQAVINGR